MTLDPNIHSSETIHRVSRQHYDCHLHNFNWSWTNVGNRGKKTVENFLEEWENGEDPHLILIGPPGVGKTHLAVGIYRYGVFKKDLSSSVYIHVPDFCHEVKQSFNKTDNVDPFSILDNASLVILDDLFGRELTDWESKHVIPRLLSTAYNNLAALVITTNYSKESMQSRLHPHEFSRLFANGKIMIIKGEDRR